MIARCGALTNGLIQIQISSKSDTTEFNKCWTQIWSLASTGKASTSSSVETEAEFVIRKKAGLRWLWWISTTQDFAPEINVLGRRVDNEGRSHAINSKGYLSTWEGFLSANWSGVIISVYILMESHGLNGGNNRGESIVTAAWLSVSTVIWHWSIQYTSFQQSFRNIVLN